MNTYYCVTSTYDDRGRVTANITSRSLADVKPENSYQNTPRKDIYNDWFETYEEAAKFADGARKA